MTAARTAPGPRRYTRLGWWLGGTLLAPIWQYGAAIIITAGPWLVAVAALAIVSVSMQPVLGRAAVEDLRLTVVYAFALAPLVAGPIGIAGARLVRRALEENRPEAVADLFLLAAAGSGMVTQVLAIGVCLALDIAPAGIAIGFVFLAVAAALLWTSFAVLGALRDYGFLIAGFTAGMCFSVGCILLVARLDPSVETLIWSLNAGLVFCVTLTAARIGALRGRRSDDLVAAGRSLAREIRQQWPLYVAVPLAIAGIWADKWVLWFGPEGMSSAAGFLHFSPYDGVMFAAHLSIIPSFAAMLVFHDGDLAEAISGFRRTLERRATLRELRETVASLGATVWQGLLTIIFVQAAVTAALLLLAPLIAQTMDFSFAQFLMLRVGLVAIFLQAIFYLTGSVLILCARHRLYLWVQSLFLGANLGASIAIYALSGVTAYAVFAASLIAAGAAFAGAYRALQSYDFLVFVGENTPLYSGTARSRAV